MYRYLRKNVDAGRAIPQRKVLYQYATVELRMINFFVTFFGKKKNPLVPGRGTYY